MDSQENQPLSPGWNKLRIASTTLASILIPVVIVVVSESYTAALKHNEIGARYVEMAISILNAPPEPATANLRKWAINVVNHHAEVRIPEEAVAELRNEDVAYLFKTLHSASMESIRQIRP